MKKLSILIFSIIFICSCSKEAANETTQTPILIANFTGPTGYLKSVSIKQTAAEPSSGGFYYNYVGNKLERKVNYSLLDNTIRNTEIYEYELNNIKKVTKSNNIDNNIAISNYFYDSSDRIVEIISTSPQVAAFKIKITYDYINISSNDVGYKYYTNDSNNNLVLYKDEIFRINSNDEVLSIRYATDPINLAHTVFQYDNKISPMYNVAGFSKNYDNFWFGEGKFHNVTSQDGLATFTYEYNSLNKPKKATVSYSNGDRLYLEFNYY